VSDNPPKNIHANCIAINGRGVLIQGPSGSGKSDLSLRLIDRGAKLVSDDRTDLFVENSTSVEPTLYASPPIALAGKMEIYALGIMEMEYLISVPIKLLVTLCATPERHPMNNPSKIIHGVPVPEIKLSASHPSAPIKIELVLAQCDEKADNRPVTR